MSASGEEKTKERTTSDSSNVPATGAVSKNIYWGCPTVCVPGEIGGVKAPKDFASNVVVTSKYTPWNFVFLFLFEQFQRIANIYFLFVSLVELNFFYLPVENAPFNTSLTKGTSNTLYALIAVIVLEGITVLAEDMKRHRSDAEANNATAHQFDPVSSTFQDVPWKNLKVGDIIQVMSGEKFPADLLLLCAATAKGGGCGQAFVETKSLDGETNLKLRTSKEEITYLFKKEGTAMGDEGTKWNPSEDTLAKLVLDGKCKTVTDDPRDAKTSVSIHTFGGQIQLSNAIATSMELGPNKTTLPMNEKNVLLRECVLRNTAYCYAVVLNTGADTKVMKSSTESGIKISDLDKEINHVISVFLMIMLVLCCIGAGIITGGYDLTNTWLESFYSPESSDTPAGLFFQSCALFFVGLAQMIPIALLVQLRMARIVQGILMGYDNQMVHVIEANVSLSGEREEIRAAVRTVNLVDELGQLSFIFSDKTGTLTQNIMEYRKMSIDGIAYGQGTTMIGIAAKEREGKKEEAKALLARLKVEESRKHVPFCNFIDGDNEGDVINGNASCYDAIEGKHKTSAAHKQKVEDFFRCLALCHSVEVEHRKTGVYYSASSPDEQALVAGAKHFGFLYEDQVTRDGKAGRGAYRVLRRAKAGAFDEMPEDQTKACPAEYFRILDVLEFTSARKRMSVIVKDGASGKIRVITKGADSKVFDNLTPAEKNGKLHLRTKAHAAGFANDGLRTLGLGQRFVAQGTYNKWKKEIDALRLDPVQTKLKKQQLPNQIDDKAGEMEVGLSLLGATAIEDKLQVGVPDAIADLARAGIKLWVLTGDKEDTAINIGFACKLLRDDMHEAVIRGEWHDEEECRKRGVGVDRVGTMKNEEELRLELIRVRQELPTDAMKYIVLDGKALDVCLDAPVLRAKDKGVPSVTSPIAVPIYQELLKVSVLCDAVVCCRVSPLQKALMVSLVKDNSPGLKTLAIGDGANDVPMIQTAHIGVGIAGQEGMQAVRASDVAIGQFRFLRRLTMVHGRANYRRAALMVCYMFYKNIVLCLAPFFYKASYGTTEDGISRFIGVTFYNTVHTAWPILLVAFYDFDITAKHSERYPRLYHSGPAKSRFNTRVFLFWVFLSFVHSFVIFLFAWYGSGGCDELGQVCTQGTTTFMGGHLTTLLLTIAVTVKVCSEFARFYWWTMFFLLISILAYPVLMFAYTAQYGYSFGVSGDALQQYYVAQVAFSYGTTWISILGVIGIVLLIDISIKNYYRYFKTSFDHLVQEAESNAHPVMYTTDHKEYRNNANNGMASDIEAANKEDDQDPFVVLDRLDEELWALEKSGHLVIPGPKLPTFKDESSGGSVQETLNPTHNRSRNDSVELTEAGGKKNAVAGGKTGGGKLPRRGSHAIERAAANNGMSQDHHASVTMAGTMRRQISDAEN